MPYLKPEDVTTPIDFEFLYAEKVTKKKKDGGSYECYEVHVKTRSDGKPHAYDVFPTTAEFIDRETGLRLIDAKPMQLVRAYKNGDFVNWKVLPMGEESVNIPSVSNSQQVKAERNLYDYDAKDRQIMYQAFAKSYIEAGNFELDDIDHFAQAMCQRCISFSQS